MIKKQIIFSEKYRFIFDFLKARHDRTEIDVIIIQLLRIYVQLAESGTDLIVLGKIAYENNLSVADFFKGKTNEERSHNENTKNVEMKSDSEIEEDLLFENRYNFAVIKQSNVQKGLSEIDIDLLDGEE